MEPGESGVIGVDSKPYRVVESSSEVVSKSSRPLLSPFRVWSFLPCIIFRNAPWCWVRQYTNPAIQFSANAVKIDDLHIYLLSGRVEGRVVTRFRNQSEPGEVWFENRETGETTDRQVVEESAMLNGRFNESIFLKNVDVALAEIRNLVSSLRPDAVIEVDTGFVKTGVLDLIGTILDLFLNGQVYVDDDIDVTVSYDWMGERHTIEKRFRYKAYLSVGNVHWHAW